jgi:predicted HTH domain antitoxin
MPIVIPDEILEGSDVTVEDIRLDVAISLYQREKVSLGKAAEIAGLNRWEFQKILAGRKIPTINYTAEDLEKELKALRCLK